MKRDVFDNDAIIVIPTYNEKENIVKLIYKIWALKISFDILVVDDNSPDKTAEVVKKLLIRPERKGELYVIEREAKLGLGTAYIHAFKEILKKYNHKYIFQMDADLSHYPEYLIKLYNEVKYRSDIAIGSRYHKWRISVINWPLKRLVISMIGQVYLRIVMSCMPICDSTGGFKGFKRHVLEQIDLDKITSTGYCFQIEMNFRAFKGGFKIVEIPIIFKDRNKGSSKMCNSIVREALIQPVKLRVKSIVRPGSFVNKTIDKNLKKLNTDNQKEENAEKKEKPQLVA